MDIFKISLIKTGRIITCFAILFFSISNNIFAQCSLSCNNGLNVSLDINCLVEITPDLILEGDFTGCAGPILIEVIDADDNLIDNNPIVAAAYINQALTVMVTDQTTGTGCEGSIFIEDYGAPTIECNDIEITCNASAHPNDIGYPIVNDSCDPNPTLTFSDQVNNLTCNADDYVQQIIRTWMAMDVSGNMAATCVQTISRTRPLLTDVVFPTNKDNIEDPALDCTNPDTTPANTGVPTINGEAIDLDGPCGMWVFHTDAPPTPLCENSYLILRTWTVNTTWCGANTSTSETQFIKVLDKTAPVLNCLADFSVSANNTSCTGNITVPAATATDDCSNAANINIQITGPIGPVTANQTINLPVGVYTFNYTATDDCGNSSTCSTSVTIDDGIAPVAICISSTTVGLTNDTPTLTPASTFDDGSYDNCGPITYLARRMDNPNCPGNDATVFNTTVPFACCDVGSVIMVEFEVTDAGTQLSNTCMVEVLVQDNLPMQLNCPDDITINCDQDYTELTITGEATGSDNCGINGLTHTDNLDGLGDCNIGQVIRTWTLTDSYGNTTSCNQTITLLGTGPGVVNFPPDVLDAECGDADDINITGTPATSGSCNQFAVGHSDLVFFLEDSCVRKTLRTWTVLDWCAGETYEEVQLIKETDTQPPIITDVPADMTVECDEVPPLVTPTVSDACTQATISLEETSVIVGCETILTRTWTATDACGNQSTAQQVLTITDTEPPTFTDPPTDEDAECDNIPAVPTVNAMDNCSDPMVEFEEIITPGNCDQAYTITRIWTATDDCGNTTTIQQTVNITDTTPPVIANVPSSENVDCDAIPEPVTPTASDNCDPNPIFTIEEIELSGSCEFNYTITRVWTATDNCGNISTASQILNVSDTTPPTISDVPTDATVECDNIPLPGNPSVSDNCDPNPGITSEDEIIAGACANEYTIIRTWTATDDCGNESTASQTLNVIDTTPPVLIGIPGDIDTECSNVLVVSPLLASDNCDPDPNVSMDSSTTTGDCEDNYTITNTWVATDACGNTSSASQTINVSDNTAPVINDAPDDLIVECDAIPEPATPTATDNCDPNPTLVLSQTGDPSEGCEGDFSIVRTWTATDRCGNASTHIQTITLIDTTAPTIEGVPDDLTLNCTEAIPEPVIPNAFDNCDNDLELIFEEEETVGVCPSNTIITRTWTATDFCDNQTAATRVITRSDTTPPVLTGIPDDVTVPCDQIPAVDPDVAATDDCSEVDIAFQEMTNPGGCTAEFGIMRVWTATDACGNVTTGTQMINTIDNTPPVLSDLPMSMEVECNLIPDAAILTATDNCDTDVPVEFLETDTPGACENEEIITRTWTATDDCGNETVHTQILTVEDRTTPTFPPMTPLINVSCENIPPAVDPVPTDNCDMDVDLTFNEVNNSGECIDGFYTIIRTWTATDNCGNISIQVLTINVTDNNNPTLIGVPDDVTLECDEIPAPDVTATDPCDPNVEVTLVEINTVGACPFSYTLTRTWTATDDCGNTDIDTQVITVEDTTPPTLMNVPADVSVSCNDVPAPANVVIIDNCDPDPDMTFNEINNPGDCPHSYTLVRTWSGLDACDNFVTATQTITVTDTEGPTFIGVPADVTVDCDAIPPPANVTAVDNCDTDVPLNFTETTDATCLNSYEIVRTWESEDDCGNMSSAVQTITVEDNEPPMIVCPVDTTFRYLGDFVPPIYCKVKDFIQVHATDNCSAVEDITITWTLDYGLDGPDGIIDSSGTIINNLPTATLADSFAVGVSLFVFTATDECGNTSTCSSTEVVIDNVPPSFFTFPTSRTLSFDPATGEWCAFTNPADYIFFLDDCCDAEVHFLLEDGSLVDELKWGCDDTDALPEGVPTPIRVIDCHDNFIDVFPKTIVNAPGEGGPSDPCGPTPPAASFITGLVYTENTDYLESVTVDLTGGLSSSTTSEANGYYEFIGVPTNTNYLVTPEMDVHPLNGVSTYDLVLMSKHILGLQELDSPYKMIAADVDRSGSISTFDMVSLKKLILGIDTVFNNNTSWRFLDANYVFPDPQNPFQTAFPEHCAINDLNDGQNLVNFIGVKVGDVNNTVTTNLDDLADTRSATLNFEAKDELTEVGELVELAFTAKDFQQVNGFQFTLNFDQSALEYRGFEAEALSNLSEEDFGFSFLDRGLLTTSWFETTVQNVEDDKVLFTLQFEAKLSAPLSRLVRITSDYTKAEAYQNGAPTLVQLTFDELDYVATATPEMTVYQNRPNPFKDQTIISFNMPRTDLVVLEIFDASGKSCFRQRQTFDAGYQEVEIQGADLPVAGVYYYELRTSTESVRNKMILF